MTTQLKLFLITSTILAAQTAFAGYATNAFFVTLGEGQTSPYVKQVVNAKTDAECQPARIDLAGHWGEEVAGKQLSIRFKKDVYQTNEPVIATIINRHTATNDDLNCSWMFGGDLGFQFVIKDEKGNTLPDSFAPERASLPMERKWLPGTQYKYQSNLSKRYGLAKPGTYSVFVQRKAFRDTNGWIYVSSDTATVKIK